MKLIKKHIYPLLVVCMIFTMSCEDLAFGDKFLQKPPSTDVTIDTVFATAEDARKVLWYSYSRMPMPLCTSTREAGMDVSNIESLTDLSHCYVGYSGIDRLYYSGTYNASAEDDVNDQWHATKYKFYKNGSWKCIRHAWILIENIDRVPDMSSSEKLRLKAEAKTLIAIYYADMFRHYGGLPLLDRSLDVDVSEWPVRGTVDQTVNFITKLLDDAINESEFPWVLPAGERANWEGRVTKAAAMALKVRVLLFAASPLFNSSEPYYPGEASNQLLTWYGDFQQSRWEAAAAAGKAFLDALNANGYYRLVQASDNDKAAGLPSYRQAFLDAYYTRGTTEILISTRRKYYITSTDFPRLDQSVRWGGFSPTKELFEMFPMADGTPFDWDNPDHMKNPFINRDPRLNETILLDGDVFQGRTAAVHDENPNDKTNYPAGRDWKVGQLASQSLASGTAVRKFALDRAGEFRGRPFQFPHLRLAEVYLSYAEALNECNRTQEAFQYVNIVRERVGLSHLSGLNKEQLRAEILRERACEFAWEDVRYFDLIRWKREDIFKKPTNGLHIYKHKDTGEYIVEPYRLSKRAWWDSFSPKWYLSAFPAAEINKGYGMIQNPGW